MRLIDADALIAKFNDSGIQITFDLPVEEILGEDVDIDDFSMLVQDAVQAYRKMLLATIKKQPTAYDVDKVAEQIKKCNYCDSNGYLEPEAVITIVKKGGIRAEKKGAL